VWSVELSIIQVSIESHSDLII